VRLQGEVDGGGDARGDLAVLARGRDAHRAIGAGLDRHIEVRAHREWPEPVLEEGRVAPRSLDLAHVAHDRDPQRDAAHIEQRVPDHRGSGRKLDRSLEILEHRCPPCATTVHRGESDYFTGYGRPA